MFIRFDVIHECDRQTDGHQVSKDCAYASHRAVKIDDFRPISRSISETVIVRWAHAANLKALNSLSIHTTFSVIAPGASPGETKMW